MSAWSIRFRGSDERDTLAKRLVASEDGTEVVFVTTAEPLWNLRPQGGRYGEQSVGTEPSVGIGPRQAEEGWIAQELPSEGEGGWVGAEIPGGPIDPDAPAREVRASGPESAQEEDAL